MSVPDNYLFSLTDVGDEIGLVAPYSLQDCFDMALPWGFDPLYEGSKNSLRNFRNYTHWVWTERTISNRTWDDVAYNSSNTRFVAVSQDGRTSYSSNLGVTWNEVTPPEQNQWASIFGSSALVSVAYNGTNEVMRSTNGGTSWSAIASADSTVVWQCVGTNGSSSTFIAAGFKSGASGVMRSVDSGSSWSMIPTGSLPYLSESWRAVAGRAGTVLIMGGDKCMRSADNGVTWASVTPFAGDQINDCVWCTGNSDNFVAVGDDNFVYTDDDGLTWTAAQNFPSGSWKSLAFGETLSGTEYVICVSDVRPSDPSSTLKCAVAAFSDLDSWFLLDLPTGNWTGIDVNTNGEFVAVSSTGKCATLNI